MRPLTAIDVEPAWAVLERSFGTDPHPADRMVESAVVDPARCYAAYDGDEPVATAGSYNFELTVPGAALPVAGVSWVGVLPTHRRRGVLTALMDRQLQDLHAAGCAAAALWASESAIYGRFGYGAAAWNLSVTLPHGAAFGSPVAAGGVRFAEPTADLLRETYDAVRARTPGWPARDDDWWAFRLHDPEHRRGGGGPLQCAVTDGGYALYSTESRWDGFLPAGVVRVRELVATTPQARTRLWRHLLDLDLMREVVCLSVAPDDPLLLDLLAEPRRARPALRDSLHVRLIDAPAALAARRYAAGIDVVLRLDDAQCPWNTGTWRLTGDRSGATCAPTTAAADLVVRPADLGAAYLGGTPLRARSVEECTPGALSPASTAFGPVDGAPWCPMVF